MDLEGDTVGGSELDGQGAVGVKHSSLVDWNGIPLAMVVVKGKSRKAGYPPSGKVSAVYIREVRDEDTAADIPPSMGSRGDAYDDARDSAIAGTIARRCCIRPYGQLVNNSSRSDSDRLVR